MCFIRFPEATSYYLSSFHARQHAKDCSKFGPTAASFCSSMPGLSGYFPARLVVFYGKGEHNMLLSVGGFQHVSLCFKPIRGDDPVL